MMTNGISFGFDLLPKLKEMVAHRSIVRENVALEHRNLD
jgi:hypothetical protein